jgi:aryl-alcohol dehydrogenase-like predicted oxidoreductase
MRYFSLPNTTLRPSVIGLGTGNYGSSISTEDSFRLLDEFAGAGGNLLDSAHIYAAWLPDGAGKSEKTIGQWIKKSGLRDKMIVATKGGHFDLATPEISRVRPECIDRDIQESQDRLQLDTIDLYYLHRDDPGVPVAELLDVLQPHLRAGRIKAIGASNWSPERLQLAQQEAKARGQIGFCCSSCAWSLAESDASLQGYTGMYVIQDEALRWHRKSQFPLIAYSAQAQGFFAQSWTWPNLPDPTPKQQALMKNYFSEKNVARWQRAQMLAKTLGCSTNLVALAYVTSQEFPSAALIGPNSLAQLRESLAAADLKLSLAQVEFVERGTI